MAKEKIEDIANTVKTNCFEDTIALLQNIDVVYVIHHRIDNPLFRTNPVNVPKNAVHIDYRGRFEDINGRILSPVRQSIYFEDDDRAVTLYSFEEESA